MQDEVAFKRDIIKAVAEELGMTEEKISSVFSFFIWRLKDLVKRPDVVSIYMHNFGTMYVKVPLLEKAINFKKVVMEGQEKVRYKQMIKCNNSALESYNYHQSKPRIENWWLRTGKTDEELEQFQNDIADGKPEKNI